VGIPTAEIAYYSTHGQRIWSEPRGIAAGYRWPQFSIHRGQLLGVLHRAMLQRLGPKRVHPDHHLWRFGQKSDHVWADFVDRASGVLRSHVEVDVAAYRPIDVTRGHGQEELWHRSCPSCMREDRRAPAQTFNIWREQAPKDFCYALKFRR
jgi:hypothetical protein